MTNRRSNRRHNHRSDGKHGNARRNKNTGSGQNTGGRNKSRHQSKAHANSPTPEAFKALGLDTVICRAVGRAGYVEPTPVQEQSIPLILAGHEVMACAQTGTGKTAAFTLPMVQNLIEQKAQDDRNNRRKRSKVAIRALVLTPTRELALQVQESLDEYSSGSGLETVAIFGGVSLRPQTRALRRGVDVIVATPGRLIDHYDRGHINFSNVTTLVLDEADRMLDMGFLPPLRKIMGWLPNDRQNLLFSATLGKEINKLAKRFMTNPKRVSVAPAGSTASTVSHVMHPVDRGRKKDLLRSMLGNTPDQALVFCRTKRGVDRLAKDLRRDNFSAGVIHGNKSQNQRTRALDAFKSGKTRILVATDVAARGLDVPTLPLVINYDLPMVARDYVHRIGRTGRAGTEGRAVSFVQKDQVKLYRGIAKLLDEEIEVSTVPGYEPSAQIDLDGNRGGRRKKNRNGGGNGRSRRNSRRGNRRGRSSRRNSR